MKYFDDFSVGETVVVGEHLLTQEELIGFAEKWDPQFFHVSPEAAEKSIFSGLIAAGTHLMSIAVLLLVKQQPSVAVLSGLGWDEVRFLAPGRPGDRLVTSRECLETRPSASKQDRGIVINRITLNNQKGQLLLTYVDTILVKKTP
ncbi:MaoC/PaaZ C-terminal domain-containing protein [Desulfoluna sp.]|uniref:MaoC/PaaZ C-terminal domain-containing protein n=1 Tax=Desulfoluna sp. TaxID=2045199 RepID=UPI0026379775|nr:MaoC/PaaZ C-terminal domain-containing protein [Desulfoluna sp.]